MKHLLTVIALILAAVTALTLTACSGAAPDSKADTPAADTGDAPTAAVSTDAPTAGFDSEAVTKELEEKIVGSWTFYNWMYKTTSNHLVFKPDGTGSYQGGVVENGQYELDYTFTYTITAEPDPYRPDLPKSTLHIQYNEIDDAEDRPLTFYDNGVLYLAYGDHTIIQYDEYTREEDIPME